MYQYHKKSRLRERAHMVLLSTQGVIVKEIGKIVYRNELTVSTWLNAFEAHGFVGLYDEPIPGRPGRLNAAELKQLENWLDDSPRQAGWQQSNWTLKLLRHALFLRKKVRLSVTRLWEIVRSLGFVRLRPRHRSIVPTPEQLVEAIQCIEGFFLEAKAGNVRLFLLDETLAMVFATLSACWARKGSRPEIKMGDDHRRVNVIAAAEPIIGKVHYRILPTVNQAGVVAFLAQMRRRYPGEELVFILDQAKPHTAKSVKQFAEADGKLVLAYLPRYTSLHCNPIERLFKWFRRVVTHNQYFESLSELKAAIQAFFRSVANLPNRVISLMNLREIQNLNSLPKSL